MRLCKKNKRFTQRVPVQDDVPHYIKDATECYVEKQGVEAEC